MTECVYFMGIGGIGMSALARWFQAEGTTVAGYDRTKSPLTSALEGEGMTIDYTGDPEALPPTLKEDLAHRRTDRWTVVWTPAIPADFPLLVALQEAGFTLHKRAAILGKISKGRPLLAVAGTHGKTTTSTLLAHLLTHAGCEVDAFLGGIALGTSSNLIATPVKGGKRWMVAEADEFDRSFLHLHPHHAVITSVDPDHLDIYGSHDRMLDAFLAFASQVSTDGLLVHANILSAWQTGSPLSDIGHSVYGALQPGETPDQRGWDAGYSEVSDQEGSAGFTLHLPGCTPMRIHWNMPGENNAANATAAAFLAGRAGVSTDHIVTGLASFSGIARRFEIKHRTEHRVLVDDYAHHPTEIAGTIAAARLAFPGKKITGVFQPHLFSRTRDFLVEFAHALDALDECILLPIYPAREKPIPGVDAQRIGEKITGCEVKCPAENRFLDVLKELDPEILLFMGAGDLDRWIGPAWETLEQSHTPPQKNVP